MNDLTRQLVTETAQAHKSAALENGDKFKHYVRCTHVEWLIAHHGWQFKQRAVDLFRLWHPEIYDGEFIQDYHQLGFDIDIELSRRAMRCLWRKVARCPDLQLTEWVDLPGQGAQPQMKMF